MSYVIRPVLSLHACISLRACCRRGDEVLPVASLRFWKHSQGPVCVSGMLGGVSRIWGKDVPVREVARNERGERWYMG